MTTSPSPFGDRSPDAHGVLIRPAPAQWPHLLSSTARSSDALALRAELDLSPDRPIILSGHQAQFWHPGIVAKIFAAHAAARAQSAQFVWLVVDHDENDPFALRYPVLRDGKTRPALAVENWNAAPSDLSTPRCAGLRPAARPAPLPTGDKANFAAPEIQGGLRAINAALAAHLSAPSAAAQVTLAAFDLLAPLLPRPAILSSTDLSRTAVFRTLVEKMAADPAHCISAYNAAVATQPPHARLRPLADNELPLWKLDRAAAIRRPATIADARTATPADLAPRALFLTALLRLAACDLFIHGTGGGGATEGEGYDIVTDRWINNWLGQTLAPVVTVSATLRLGIDSAVESPPSPAEIDRARWLAHHAQHNPAILEDASAVQAHHSAVATLTRLHHRRDADSRREKKAAYIELHKAIAASRDRNADRLAALSTSAAASAARRVESVIAADRTWAFPLYHRPQLEQLQSVINKNFLT